MKIVTWNLNHRTNPKPIPDTVLHFFEAYNPDLVLLNEYVDGPSRDSFKTALKDLGFEYHLLSEKIGKHNQVFALSSINMKLGDLSAPDLTAASTTNFLHVKVPSTELEIVGLRAPAFKTVGLKKAYWNQVASIASEAATRNIVFVGDVNYDPFDGVSSTASEMTFELSNSYKIPNPKGKWSYISPDGKRKTRIDHAFFSRTVMLADVHYLDSFAGIQLAGERANNAVSDHAVLSLTAMKKQTTNKTIESDA